MYERGGCLALAPWMGGGGSRRSGGAIRISGGVRFNLHPALAFNALPWPRFLAFPNEIQDHALRPLGWWARTCVRVSLVGCHFLIFFCFLNFSLLWEKQQFLLLYWWDVKWPSGHSVDNRMLCHGLDALGSD
jgi:hypothetical protein